MIVVNVDVVAGTLRIESLVYPRGKNGTIVPVLVPVLVQPGVNVRQDILLIMLTLVIVSPHI